MSEAPKVTIVIPIYNEEGILRSSVVDLIDRLRAFDFRYELLLAENGRISATNRPEGGACITIVVPAETRAIVASQAVS